MHHKALSEFGSSLSWRVWVFFEIVMVCFCVLLSLSWLVFFLGLKGTPSFSEDSLHDLFHDHSFP